jgi:hypothetical protein
LLKLLTIRSTTEYRLFQRVIVGVIGSWSWSQKPPGSATIEPDLSSTSITLGVTIGMSTTASPQSSGSNEVLPLVGPVVGSLAVPVAETSLVVPALVPEAELLSPSVAVKVVSVVRVFELIVFEFEFEAEFDSEPSSEHAPVRADMRDRRHALRFISW